MADWLKTEDGKVRLIVLKPFHFNVPVSIKVGEGERIDSGTRIFRPGEQLLDPANANDAAVLNHSWIAKHFADGCIENPGDTRAREEAEAVKAAQVLARHAALRAEAEAELQRAKVAGESQAASEQAIQDEMNTPVNQLRAGARRRS